jgi:hypothetical protein
MWDALFDYNGSFSLMSALAVIPLYIVIWNVEPHMLFQMGLREKGHICFWISHLFSKLIVLSSNAVGIECYNFQRQLNCYHHYVSVE